MIKHTSVDEQSFIKQALMSQMVRSRDALLDFVAEK